MLFKKKPQKTPEPMVPFRLAEICRLSMYTIAANPDIPEATRTWITDWLQKYNAGLEVYFIRNGDDKVWAELAKITDEVRASGGQQVPNEQESFHEWERQMNDE